MLYKWDHTICNLLRLTFFSLSVMLIQIITCINSSKNKDAVNRDKEYQGFPGGAVVENLPANAGDTGSSPGLGRSHMLQSN